MTILENDRKSLVLHKIQKAAQTLGELPVLVENGFLATAVNRAYYSVFYAVSALALLHSFSTSKHNQLIGWFNRNIIKSNILDRQYGDIYRQLYELRRKGDYDDYIEFSSDDIRILAEQANDFVRKITSMIEGLK
jgi:uncharacterized protein (UPF0332 family)